MWVKKIRIWTCFLVKNCLTRVINSEMYFSRKQSVFWTNFILHFLLISTRGETSYRLFFCILDKFPNLNFSKNQASCEQILFYTFFLFSHKESPDTRSYINFGSDQKKRKGARDTCSHIGQCSRSRDLI